MATGQHTYIDTYIQLNNATAESGRRGGAGEDGRKKESLMQDKMSRGGRKIITIIIIIYLGLNVRGWNHLYSLWGQLCICEGKKKAHLAFYFLSHT